MKKKRLFGIALALVMVLQLVLPMPWVSAVSKNDVILGEQEGSFLKLYNKADGSEITDDYDELPMDATLILRWAFQMPYLDGEGEDVYYDAGDTYVVDFSAHPQLSKLLEVAGFTLLSEDDPLPLYVNGHELDDDYIFGYLTVSPSGVATVTFTEYFTRVGNHYLEGWFELEGEFSAEKIEDAETPISFTFAGTTYTLGFVDPPDPTVKIGIGKSGVYLHADSGGEIEWTVIVTPEAAASGVSVVDTYGANQTYVEDSFQVGTALDALTGIPDAGGDLTVSIGTRTLTYVFPGEIAAPQYIKYRTKPTSTAFAGEDSVSFKNDAVVKIGETPRNNTTANVTLNWIDKDGEKNDAERSIDWTITVNKPDSKGTKHTVTGAFIRDVIPAGLDLDPDSVSILLPGATQPVPVTDVDHPVAGRYTYTEELDGTHILTYYFNVALTGSAELTFTTIVDGDEYYDSNTPHPFTNTAEFHFNGSYDGTPSDSKTVGVGTHVINKTSTGDQSANYDHTSNRIFWEIVVNENGISIASPVTVTDTLDPGLALDPDSVEILLPGEPAKMPVTEVAHLVAGKFSYNPTNGEFVYTFAGSLSDRAVLTFETTIEDPTQFSGVLLGNGDASILNTAILKSGDTEIGRDTGSKTYSSQMIDKDTVGSYDYTTRQMTWKITVNRNKLPLTDVKIVDTIPAGLELVDDGDVGGVYILLPGAEEAVRVSKSDSQEAGKYTYAPGDDDTHILTYYFGGDGDLNGEATLIFTTEVQEPFLHTQGDKVFLNTGKLISYQIPGGITATAEVPVKNPIMEKDFEYDEGADFIKWIVPINSNKIVLSGVKITDPLDKRLDLDVTSVRLYFMELQANGDLVVTSDATKFITLPRLDEEDLSNEGGYFTYDTSPAEHNLFSVYLPKNSGTQAYQLEFYTDIIGTNSLTINNTVNFSGSTTSGSASSDVKSFTVSANGGGDGYNPDITVTKLGENNQPLSGTTFELYDISLGIPRLLATKTTGNDGQVIFDENMRFKTYYVRETIAPEGYLIATDSLEKTVRLSKDNVNADVEFKNELALGTITFLKQNVSGSGLAGAQFALYNASQQGGGELEPLPVAIVTSLAPDGRVTFENIPLGVYELKEIKAPSGYRIRQDIWPVVVHVSYANQGQDQTAVEVSLDPDTVFVNDRAPVYPNPLGTIMIQKTDGEGKALAGAEFTLYDDSGKAVETAVSGSDGRVVFSDLPYGRYTVKETGVPEGYEGSDTVISVNVQRDTTPYEYTVENQLLEEPEDPNVPGDGEDPDDPDDGDDGEDLGDPNAPGGGAKPDPDNSPKTGSPSFYPLWLLLLGSLTGIATVLRYPKKRRGEN